MNVARILYPVKVLGPGNRVGIWLCGCNRACNGCSNPELRVPRAEFEISVEDVLALVNTIRDKYVIDGFTITGGEPFQQSKELLELIRSLRMISDDILVYTGYLEKDLLAKKDATVNQILDNIAVLIDGPYLEELNTGVRLRGSSNQTIIIKNSKYRDVYKAYSAGNNQIQNFVTSDGIVSVGIHNRGFSRSIKVDKEEE